MNLAAYSGDTVQLRFSGTNNTFAGDIAIDQVAIDSTPQCPDPTNLMLSAISGNSATLSWTSGGAVNRQIEYGPTGFTLGQGTRVVTTNNPFTVNGLSPNQSYEFYVRDSCSAALQSGWTLPATGTTTCGVLSVPFAENFDGPDWLPGFGAVNTGSQVSSCWSRPIGINPDFGAGNGRYTFQRYGPNNDVSGNGNYLYTEASNGALGAGSISTPPIYLPAHLSTASLRFQYHLFGADIDSLEVRVDDGSGYTTIYSLLGLSKPVMRMPGNLPAWYWMLTWVIPSIYVLPVPTVALKGILPLMRLKWIPPAALPQPMRW
ncbi:MAG: fibronectin type III domain-containing protein [Owenweeksia sp.]|nr:fibronectin type III domain-containing protein [Owenweeksia sp.]